LVAVRDSGVGIDPQSVRGIVEALYSTKTSGMGMGLSICRSIVESHGGTIWASPNEGPGATFQFALPGRMTFHAKNESAGEDPNWLPAPKGPFATAMRLHQQSRRALNSPLLISRAPTPHALPTVRKPLPSELKDLLAQLVALDAGRRRSTGRFVEALQPAIGEPRPRP
jgi:hypothetical protein